MTSQRKCACGCGVAIYGRRRYATNICRKHVEVLKQNAKRRKQTIRNRADRARWSEEDQLRAIAVLRGEVPARGVNLSNCFTCGLPIDPPRQKFCGKKCSRRAYARTPKGKATTKRAREAYRARLKAKAKA